MVENPAAVVLAHPFQVEVGFALSIAWILAEYYGRRSTWNQGAPRRPPSTLDRGTYPVIAVGITIGMASTALCFLSGWGGYLPEWVSVVGASVTGIGLAIRYWALSTLGRFFTMPITIRPDHQLVSRGPYHWLRHPSYTGGLLTAIGLPLGLGTPVGFAVTLAACLSAYVYRIRIEEAALVSRFGETYRSYRTRTWRLIPGIY